jgi:hypothetical protein
VVATWSIQTFRVGILLSTVPTVVPIKIHAGDISSTSWNLQIIIAATCKQGYEMERPLEASPRLIGMYLNPNICTCSVLLYEDGSTEFLEGRPCVDIVDRTENCKQLHQTIVTTPAMAYFRRMQEIEKEHD